MISNIVEYHRPKGGLGSGEAVWHADMTYVDQPPKGAVLYAPEIPPASVAPIPVRAKAAEELLCGNVASRELIAEVAEAAEAATDPSSDGQGSADYKREITRVWVRRLLEETLFQ